MQGKVVIRKHDYWWAVRYGKYTICVLSWESAVRHALDIIERNRFAKVQG